jgi:hypothetical protein
MRWASMACAITSSPTASIRRSSLPRSMRIDWLRMAGPTRRPQHSRFRWPPGSLLRERPGMATDTGSGFAAAVPVQVGGRDGRICAGGDAPIVADEIEQFQRRSFADRRGHREGPAKVSLARVEAIERRQLRQVAHDAAAPIAQVAQQKQRLSPVAHRIGMGAKMQLPAWGQNRGAAVADNIVEQRIEIESKPSLSSHFPGVGLAPSVGDRGRSPLALVVLRGRARIACLRGGHSAISGASSGASPCLRGPR